MILESSIGKYKVVEQSIDFSTERVRSQEVPVEQEEVKNEEDDELIFRKMNIPWLSDKSSILQEGMSIDSEVDNLKKTMKQCNY